MTDPRLERYLGSLEAALRPFPVGDRAEIVTEIKSHVLSALDRDPTARLDSILDALGEPEIVANRYLLERGLKPSKPPISPIVKWLVIGSLASFAMLLIFCAFMAVWFFRDVHVTNDRFTAMNGMIDIDGKKNRVSIRGFSDSDNFGGSVNVADKVSLIFDGGALTVSTAEGAELTWSCRGEGSAPNPKELNGETILDLSGLARVKCDIGIPAKKHLTLKGRAGKVDFQEPRFSIKAVLDSGKMAFADSADASYKFATSIQAGKIDEFKSSAKPDALTVDMHVGSGRLSHDN